MKNLKRVGLLMGLFLGLVVTTQASEADLAIPDLHEGTFHIFGTAVTSWDFLFYGALIIAGTLGFSLLLFNQVKKLPAHESMTKVASTIYATCRTYLIQQGKFLLMLFALIAIVLCIYFFGLIGQSLGVVLQVLAFSIIGMAGSYIVAWYGIRVNTYANARTAFASLKGRPLDVVNIPMKAGMSVGLFLISLELVLMVVILLFVPRDIVGICFLGFAIGESLGASALRIAGGIFTKIADIGSDLMKVVFKVKEDDPRNPGVIADCTGDNAGDSVGPTADGFETYGVTGVALITFITLAVPDPQIQAKLIVWIFGMRFLMDFLSGCAFFINQGISKVLYSNKKHFDFESPLMRLIIIAAVLCISASFFMSHLLLGDMADATLWWKLAIIISCGTLAAVLIPEFTKIFTSSKSKHVKEIVTASREGGPSLNILSGIVAGYFGAFWTGLLIVALMTAAFFTAQMGLDSILGPHATIFAFGLVAFGFLCMGPVTIAVDSYGPVTDNAQSVFELSQIDQIPNISESIEKEYGFEPDLENGKHYLEANDSAGNTFKATAKPVLIGTAVVGATTMIFSIILLLEKVGLLSLSLTDAPVLLGLICGGAVIFWFSGASMQAVTTGAYRAVEFIKRTFDINKKEADIDDSIAVVKICTQYAQKGMWNIFIALISLTLAFAFLDPNFFVAYLVSIAVFGLFQAIYMANAGGSWDNAKKVVEVDLKEKNTPLHEAAVIGDTVGDPFKDTSSVSLNPIIKFSTLFGLLATEICIEMRANPDSDYSMYIAIPFLILGLVFVWRSFYKMRIPEKEA
ncbi:MAG: sodium-translocating pyrophosphatase [Prevotella sp.]|jgi:K(+)-stimulated pyrophosphate-energized sodium pump|nr:sodium-translocating pyrophosphatase [Prevotella sp.]